MTKQGKEPVQKPHGRLAQSLLFPGFGDPRWIDLSVMSKGEPIVTLRSWDAEDIAIAAADAGITGSKFEALLVALGERR